MAEKPDINPTHLKIVTDILQKNLPQDVVVWVFGSRAKWTAKEYSDLDLALEGKNGGKIPMDIIARLDDDFEDSDLPWKVDVVDINAVAQSFKEIIIKDRVKLEEVGYNSILGDIAELVMGQSPKGEDCNIVGMGVPLLNGPTEFSARHPIPVQFTENGKKFSNVGDILFCVRGSTTGRMNYADQRYALGRGIAAIRGKSGYPTPYVRAVIERNLPRILASATGSTFPNVGRDMLNNFEINTVSTNDAQVINKFLVSIEDKTYLNQRMNKTLEEMAQAIFKCWFVDFEPTRAKIAQKEGSGESDADICTHLKITPQILSLFPNTLTNSDLGPIPEGWKVKSLDNYLTIKRGGSPRPIKDYIVKQGLPWVKIADATKVKTPYLFETKECIKEEGLKKTVFLKSGSLILSNSATPGLPKFLQLDACIHDGWLHFPNIDTFSKEYLYLLFLKIREELVSKGSGSVFTNLKTDILKQQLVINAGEKLLEKFDEIIAGIFENIKSNETQSRTLSQIRDTLLPKLLSGEISVGEAENIEEGL